MNFKRKTKSILITFLLLGGVITSTGCQAASDLFNPDTYNFYNTEPWERNKKKTAKPKTLKDQM
ncbi:MAG: hypothetical protein WBO68_05700 [Pyrinomonadaceae bacterium]